MKITACRKVRKRRKVREVERILIRRQTSWETTRHRARERTKWIG